MLKALNAVIEDFCRENHIRVALSSAMPVGYESAYGTYDVTLNTLFLNEALLEGAPCYEVLFYLFHELRHAVQYLCPSRFEVSIQESRFYVVLYNGQCYKLAGRSWQACRLEGEETYFTRMYQNLPYERDANAFAYEKVAQLCGKTAELETLYAFWTPEDGFSDDEYKKLFAQIESAVSTQAKK